MSRGSSSRKKSLNALATTYMTFAIALGVALFALVLLFFSLNDALWEEGSLAPVLLTEIGGLLLVSAALTLVWELFAKRQFANELFEKAGISESIRETGLISALDDFQKLDGRSEPNWEDILGATNSIDFFVAGGTGWDNNHSWFFERLQKTQGAQINVFLPDPEGEKVVKELTSRFEDYTEEDTIKRLRKAEKYFRGVREKATDAGAIVNIRFVPMAPMYTFYFCGRVLVVALYKHKPYSEDGTVPVFIFGPGTMYDYFEREKEYLESVGRAASVSQGETRS